MNVLVVGLGVSGIACIKGLSEAGAKIYAFDEASEESLKDRLKEIEGIEAEYFFGNEEIDKINMGIFDYAIKSPGIKYEAPIIERLVKNKIEIISDIEAAYRATKATIVSITGTNGKTTTTSLIGEIVKASNKTCKVTGNIGFGIYYDAIKAKEDDILVAEVSNDKSSLLTIESYTDIVYNVGDSIQFAGVENNKKIFDAIEYLNNEYGSDAVSAYFVDLKNSFLFETLYGTKVRIDLSEDVGYQIVFAMKIINERLNNNLTVTGLIDFTKGDSPVYIEE
jgi:UDP-N-acetylmuramate-alanine ligase